MTEMPLLPISDEESQKALLWFRDKTFPELFKSQWIAKDALAELGFVESYGWFYSLFLRRYNNPKVRQYITSIKLGIAVIGVILLSIAFTYMIPRDSKLCYIVSAKAANSLGANLGNGEGKICPAERVTDGFLSAIKTFLSPDLPAVISSLSVIIALSLGAYQWQFSRTHAAFSEAFARKFASNQAIIKDHEKLGDFIRAAQANDGCSADSIVSDIFIYMEMDNLEYVFEKYRDGEISAKSALRQCFIFVSRCGVEKFRSKAVEFSEKGFYRPEFSHVVKMIAAFTVSPSAKNVLKDRISI